MMIRITTLAALLISTLASLNAHAELIQVEFRTHVQVYNEWVTVKMIFDTSSPPDSSGPQLKFYPLTAGIWTTDSPLVQEVPDLDLNNPSTYTTQSLTYESAENAIFLELYDFVNFQFYSFYIGNVTPAFNPKMDSLPDNRADWIPDPATVNYRAIYDLKGPWIHWNSIAGYSGGFLSYSVEVLPEPSNACSPADMNEDGQLDFFDVSEFLQIFGLGCP